MHPKKYKTGNFRPQKYRLHADYSNHAFGSCRNFGLNCVRTISLAWQKFEPKKIRADFSDPKKYTVKSSTQKNTGVENFRPKKIRRTPCQVYTQVPHLGNCSHGTGPKWIRPYPGTDHFCSHGTVPLINVCPHGTGLLLFGTESK